MGKKFIDKKKSATFQLLARNSSSSSSSTTATDRVFVRVDNNPYSIPALEEFAEEDGEPELLGDESIFADAHGDADDEGSLPPPWTGGGVSGGGGGARGPLPDQVRREIQELGLPDDGYNYLLHLREIRNSGGGSAYYPTARRSSIKCSST